MAIQARASALPLPLQLPAAEPRACACPRTQHRWHWYAVVAVIWKSGIQGGSGRGWRVKSEAGRVAE
eukprot:10922877-Prorocentrum_lima.AAC.1